jgi:phage gpG-like protein
MANKFNFGGMDKKAKQAMKEAITIIANDAKNHYVSSFKKGGFTDESFEAWKPRKTENKKSEGRAILVKKGDLRRSIKSRVNLAQLLVTIKSDLPYSAIHNYGGNINIESRKGAGTIKAKIRGSGKFVNGKFTKGRSKTIKLLGKEYTTGAYDIKMPQRQFIGKSAKVDKMAINTIERKIDILFK